MQDLARFSQMEKLLLLLLLLMIKPSTRTVENDQDRLAVKKPLTRFFGSSREPESTPKPIGKCIFPNKHEVGTWLVI